MTQAASLARIVRELERAGIAHMVAGSVASAYHGEARSTVAIDLVIDPDRASLERFLGQLDPESTYVSREAALEALRRRGQFNVVFFDVGWKVDLILRKDRPFSEREFARREPAEIAGVPVFVATAEDTIVAKLEWAQAGESERQLRDVVGILQMRAGELDLDYVQHWVDELGLGDVWERAKSDPEF